MSIQRAASAGFWSTIDVAARQVVQFVVSLILARLLMPADFGVIALMTFFSSLAQVFVQGGLTTALLQRRETTIEQESTIFWVNLIASLAFGLILVAVAPAVSAFYDQPVLRPLLFVAAGQIVLSALGSVHAALLSRQLDFSKIAKAGVLSAALSGGIGVASALLGAGLWALALQSVVATATYSAALWMVGRWRPRFHLRPRSIAPMLRFGVWVSISSILEVLYSQGFSLLVGKLHGVRDLGLYNRAAGTQSLPSLILSSIIGRVALPLFASRSDDRDAMRRGMRMALSVVMFINVPVMVGLALLPDLVLHTLFGAKWVSAAPILSILAVSGLLYPMHAINVQTLLAQGASRTFFQLEVWKKLVGISCVAIGSLFGIQGLAWSQVVASVVSLALNTGPTQRRLGYGALSQLWDLKGIFSCALVMGCVVWFGRSITILPPALALTVLVPIGALVYFACGFAFRISAFTETLQIARMMLRRQPSMAPATGLDLPLSQPGSGRHKTPGA